MKSAWLVLSDGSYFHGRSVGSYGESIGEIVFNTSMTGYQEVITDPSYANQIVILTNPHIGNVGVNKWDCESLFPHIKGLVICHMTIISSNFRCTSSFSEYLMDNNVIAISNIDTRSLTRIIRFKGIQYGCIISNDTIEIESILFKIKQYCMSTASKIVNTVGTTKKYVWNQGTYNIYSKKFLNSIDIPYHVIVYDFGVKRNILRILVNYGCLLTVVPAFTKAQEIIDMKPDGIFLSNGPGDPNTYEYAISTIHIFCKKTNIPLFGVCLGHQLLALAMGAKIKRMKFGHHGSNHPVKDTRTNKIMITAQNHNFVVDKNTLPNMLKITHISLFDQTLQGFFHLSKPIFGFQGHPEASPGPHDAISLFDSFIELIKIYRTQHF